MNSPSEEVKHTAFMNILSVVITLILTVWITYINSKTQLLERFIICLSLNLIMMIAQCSLTFNVKFVCREVITFALVCIIICTKSKIDNLTLGLLFIIFVINNLNEISIVATLGKKYSVLFANEMKKDNSLNQSTGEQTEHENVPTNDQHEGVPANDQHEDQHEDVPANDQHENVPANDQEESIKV